MQFDEMHLEEELPKQKKSNITSYNHRKRWANSQNNSMLPANNSKPGQYNHRKIEANSFHNSLLPVNNPKTAKWANQCNEKEEKG